MIMKNTFEVTSGKIVCSDPCYEIPTWCQGIADNVANGIWEAGIEYESNRVKRLFVTHTNSNTRRIEDFVGESIGCYGVDSGQFGFFDYDYYRNDKIAENLQKQDFGAGYDKEDGDSWYRACCKITIDENWGVMPFGAVSSSGWGDGSYEVKGVKNENDEWVGFCVEFISDYEDDEEEEYEEEEDF